MSNTKITLVTGATGGIGGQICKRLAKDRHQVIAADINIDPDDNGMEIATLGKNIIALHINIRDPESVTQAIQSACAGKKLHGLVNCAGLLRHGHLEAVTEEGLETVWDVNVSGMVRICQAAVPYMESGSAIVNISSITASIGRLRGGGIYGASKAGMETYTRYLASELAPQGIRVNALAPGFIKVLPMSPSMRFIAFGDTDEQAIAWLNKQIPMQRLGLPEEMAGPVAFLLSEDASYITGQVLIADGGVVGN